jgi:hypothetical protein
MSFQRTADITPEEALRAFAEAKAKYTPRPELAEVAAKHGFDKDPYTPPGPGCTCASGIGPSESNCAAYKANDDWLTPAFVQNATCACEKTPDCDSANAVRKTLQDELANTPDSFKDEARKMMAKGGLEYELWIATVFAPQAYKWHIKAYQSGCCKCGPAPFVDWVMVCTIPIKWCWLVDEAINLFGSCNCTPGKW